MLLIAVAVVGLFFPQRELLGLDTRESTPGFKRQVVILNAETRSLSRASVVMQSVLDFSVSTNTIERICLEVGEDLTAAEQAKWQAVLTGEVPVPELAIVECDGGRIRTRKTGCGPGVHLSGKGWNETKNAIFVSATSATSLIDPAPDPPACFLDRNHVAKLTETAKAREKAGSNATGEDEDDTDKTLLADDKAEPDLSKHKPQRILRTVISSMKNSTEFGEQMKREADRRKFDQASRKGFVGDGLPCNWTIQQTHFSDYVPILDFIHAVTYLFTAATICLGKDDAGWELYCDWMTRAWRGKIDDILIEMAKHQQRIGLPEKDSGDDDPREQLRQAIGYLTNNRERMRYDEYRRQGLPTTSAWMESTVKQINYRVKGTEMFWNNPTGAEAILQIRAAAISDDDRLVRFLTNRPGQTKLRRSAAAHAA